MDPGHPLYHSLRELYARTVGVGARIADAIKDRGAEVAFIFGSYAQGGDDATSDIDVFVLGDPDWKTLSDLGSKLYEELRREVNFVTYQEAQLDRALEAGSPFLRTLRDSPKIWIVGDHDGFDRRLAGLGSQVRGSASTRSPQPRRRAVKAGIGRAQPRASSPRARSRRS